MLIKHLIKQLTVTFAVNVTIYFVVSQLVVYKVTHLITTGPLDLMKCGVMSTFLWLLDLGLVSDSLGRAQNIQRYSLHMSTVHICYFTRIPSELSLVV